MEQKDFSNFVGGHPRKISMKYLEINPLAYAETSFKGFPTFSFDGHFVQHSGTILVLGHPRYISMKLFCKQSIGPGDAFKGLSILALVVICFPFQQVC